MTAIRSTLTTYCDGWSFRLIKRWKVQRTSSAVTGFPLANRASASLNRQPLPLSGPSGMLAQDAASAGFTSR
jgi:hypothetical protein